MKKLFFIILAIILTSGVAMGQKTIFSGTLEGLPEGASALLGKVNGNRLELVDTLRLDSKGAFGLELSVKEPAMFVVQVAVQGGVMSHVMLESGEKVHVDYLYLPSHKSLKLTKVKGSENMELYRQFYDLLLAAVNPTLQAVLPGQIEQLLQENNTVLMSAFLVTYFDQAFEQHVETYQKVCNGLKDRYGNTPFVSDIAQRLKNTLLPGMEAPEIAMKDADGNIRKLSDLRGKVVLIDFWASWCGPCRRENPNVVKMYNRYHPQGLEIYSVSLDKTRDAWLKAIKEDGLIWPNHVSDLNGWTSSGGKAYGIMSIPATVLVGPDGKIIARNLRGKELEAAIVKALGN